MTQLRSAARWAQQVARALGDDRARIVWLGGSTSAVYHLPDPDLVVKIHRYGTERAAAVREINRARMLGRSTAFVVPVDGERAVLDLPNGAFATVWRFVRPGAPDYAQLGAVVRLLHATPVAEAIAGGVPAHRLDDLGDVAASLARCDEPKRFPRAIDALRRSCDQLQTALDELRTTATLVHGDLHPRNVIWSADGPVLCDTDEVGISDPRWDLAFLFDPGRPQRLTGAAAEAFVAGYGAPAPDEPTARIFARAAHLRRTVKLLRDPRPHDAWWNLVRLGSWRRMLASPSLDLVPAVAQPRTEQIRSALAALAPRLARCGGDA